MRKRLLSLFVLENHNICQDILGPNTRKELKRHASAGNFDFTGRRDIRKFILLVKELGLHVLMRIGPWECVAISCGKTTSLLTDRLTELITFILLHDSHGECRNGGHPDWVISAQGAESCGKLRSSDPLYIACVKGWYSALAEQMKGLYYMDGGPITLVQVRKPRQGQDRGRKNKLRTMHFVQVDNETSDWKFLLALRTLGLSLGITPCSYTKTGWPSPAAGYPEDYPMLPFFGVENVLLCVPFNATIEPEYLLRQARDKHQESF